MPRLPAHGVFIGAAAALLIGLSAPARADDIDPALAKSWAFMQKEMPGVPYSLLKAACAEKQLTIYQTVTANAADNQVKVFEELFPCLSVKSLQLATGPLRERFLSEANARRPVADITQDSDSGALNKEAAQGLFARYTIANDKSYPDALKNSGYWYPLQLFLIGIAWNTGLVSDDDAKILGQWKGIADPRWKGRAGVVDAASGGASLLTWYAWQKLYGDAFISQIAALKPRQFSGTNPASAALASGDIAVLFNASDSAVLPLHDQGAPIQWSLPEPAIATPVGQAISAIAPHPNAARLYQEYAFTLDGYEAWQKLGGPPTRVDYKDPRDIAKESWYKYPTQFFSVDTADVNSKNRQVTDFVHQQLGTAE